VSRTTVLDVGCLLGSSKRALVMLSSSLKSPGTSSEEELVDMTFARLRAEERAWGERAERATKQESIMEKGTKSLPPARIRAKLLHRELARRAEHAKIAADIALYNVEMLEQQVRCIA